MGFCALSKLVYFKTQLLGLVESSIEMPSCVKQIKTQKKTVVEEVLD